MGDVSETLLGRRTLEALGINTKELLAAAVDRMGSSVDIGVLLPQQNFPEGKLSRILSQSLFHQDKGVMGESYDDEEESWLDLGQDTKAEMDEAINKAVLSAAANGISTNGQAKMQDMLYEYRDVLRICLGNDQPAKGELMVVEVKKGSNPVCRTIGDLGHDPQGSDHLWSDPPGRW